MSGGVRGGFSSPSPAAVARGRGRASVCELRGDAAMLNPQLSGPGRVRGGQARGGQGVSAARTRATRAAYWPPWARAGLADAVLLLDMVGC
jgi:hypothetical protein